MLARTLLALTTGLLLTAQFGAAQDPGKAVEAELKRLDGEWRVVAAEWDGAPVESRTVARFSRGKLTLTEPGSGLPPQELALALDPTKALPWLDVTTRTGKTQLGIYELRGDTLRVISQPDPAGVRPEAFRAAKGTGLMMYTYQRVKTK